MKSIDVDTSGVDFDWGDTGVDFHYVTPEDGLEILDSMAREYVGISGEEFLRKCEVGENSTDCSGVMRVSMLIPLTTPK
ncbi:hypothetical protein BH23CHL1_BH23CHL1_03590 [soil metagenome]